MTSSHPRDFPDWLPPMLVKELRQGMRGSFFAILFMVMHASLVLLMFIATKDTSTAAGGRMMSALIFGIFGFFVLIVQPMRGLHSLASEANENTLEMISVSGLRTTKVVLGKWVASSGQTLLLFITLLPYLIMRYFLGGMNLVAEIVVLSLILFSSLAMTACTVAFSAYQAAILRYTLGAILGILASSIIFAAYMSATSAGYDDLFSLTTRESIATMAALLICLCHATHTMLSLGATLIAPPTENHAISRRLSALCMLLAMIPVVSMNLLSMTDFFFTCFVIAAPTLAIALTESSAASGTTTRRFARFGIPGKLTGSLLQSTRTSGSLFALLYFSVFVSVLAIGVNRMLARGHPAEMGDLIPVIALAGALLVPASWQAFFFKKDEQRMGNFILIMVVSVVMLVSLKAMPGDYGQQVAIALFAWHPLAFLEIGTGARTDLIILGLIICLHASAILFSTLLAMKRGRTTVLPTTIVP